MIKQDNFQEMRSRTPTQFYNSKVFNAIFEAWAEIFDELQEAFFQLNEKRWVDTAEGKQLDGCGEIVARPRLVDKAIQIPFFGFSEFNNEPFGAARFRDYYESGLESSLLADTEYRQVIKAKIFKNMSKGTLNDVSTSYSMIFNAPASVIEVGNATIRIAAQRELLAGEKILANALDLFVKPAGVGFVERLAYNPQTTFGFAEFGLQGFGNGTFADTF